MLRYSCIDIHFCDHFKSVWSIGEIRRKKASSSFVVCDSLGMSSELQFVATTLCTTSSFYCDDDYLFTPLSSPPHASPLTQILPIHRICPLKNNSENCCKKALSYVPNERLGILMFHSCVSHSNTLN